MQALKKPTHFRFNDEEQTARSSEILKIKNMENNHPIQDIKWFNKFTLTYKLKKNDFILT